MLQLLLLGAGVAYFAMQKKSAASPTIQSSMPRGYQPAQPSQTYPYKNPQAPRVDNANQPWYAGAKAAMGSPADSSKLGSITQVLGAGSSVVHSLSDVWGNLSDQFGGNDAKATLTSTDNIPTADETSAGAAVDQSNIVGSQMSDAMYYPSDTQISLGISDTDIYGGGSDT